MAYRTPTQSVAQRTLQLQEERVRGMALEIDQLKATGHDTIDLEDELDLLITAIKLRRSRCR